MSEGTGEEHWIEKQFGLEPSFQLRTCLTRSSLYSLYQVQVEESRDSTDYFSVSSASLKVYTQWLFITR